METLIASAILGAVQEGNLVKATGFVLIFVVIWLEVRGVKKQLTTMNTTISKGFAAGEQRFEGLESKQLDFEHRLTMLEDQKN